MSAWGAIHRRFISAPRATRVASALEALVAEHARSDGMGPAQLLDVGCGDGVVGQKVAFSIGARARGVDVKLQPNSTIDVALYDGTQLPFADDAFDVVLVSDVLHHAQEPRELLRECLRVGRLGVALKDHLRFGPMSQALLRWMDVAGNHDSGVAVTGRYFSLEEWVELVRLSGGRIAGMRWPLHIHDLPWRFLTRSELQFAAFIAPQDRP